MFKKIGILVLLGVIIAIGVLSIQGDKQANQLVDFEVKKNENIWNTAGNLKKAGIIESKIYFVTYAFVKNYRGKIKAGKYSISPNLKTQEILILLSNGSEGVERESRTITFPPYFSLKQIAKLLTDNNFDGEAFLELINSPEYFKEKYGFEFLGEIPAGKNLEGYLFPDTHSFFVDASAEEIIVKMLNNFDRRISPEIRSEIKKQNKTIYEILTMASIIEKESNNANDKRIVSGIFYNRIKSGQALQSCATLAFVLGEDKDQYSYEDTQVKSPYNTYLNAGLPPGPIVNPTLESIMAAIYPTKTNYYYFLNNPKTKETFFATTLEEHNRNKDKNGL